MNFKNVINLDKTLGIKRLAANIYGDFIKDLEAEGISPDVFSMDIWGGKVWEYLFGKFLDRRELKIKLEQRRKIAETMTVEELQEILNLKQKLSQTGTVEIKLKEVPKPSEN